MVDEEEEKMKKMRVRIERDAYSVLLSFKDGASPNQVEQRMDDTLGYTYSGKYHLAGVYDMSQILREHPKVRRNVDGKFKIIATEENQDLVALIAKQKDNKRKKGGVSGKGGRRAVTSIGHHHRSGLILRSSPKFSNGMRPTSSTGKVNMAKQFSNVPNFGRPLTSTASRPTTSKLGGAPGMFYNRQSFFGTTPNKIPAPAKAPTIPLQRPLVRPKTASSVSSNSASLVSSRSTVTVAPPSRSAQPPNHMPSIKEFSDNAKIMMLKLYPEAIHLSEMTERYSQEYGNPVEPLQLFSKSWMMLVKSTFKEWLQIKDGEVSLKEDWFARFGSALKKSISINASGHTKTSEVPSKSAAPVSTSSIPTTLPTNQGFRYQIPASQPKSPVELATQQMRGLTMGARHALRTPDKPPGLAPKNSSKLMVTVFPGLQSVQKDSKSATSNGLIKIGSSENSAYTYRAVSRSSSDATNVDFLVPNQKLMSVDRSYDAKQLKNLKMVEKTNALKHTVDEALNGKENPHLKKAYKKTLKTSPSGSTKANASYASGSNSKGITGNTSPTPTMESLRSCFSTGPNNRLIGRALAAIHKQNDEQKPLMKNKSFRGDTSSFEAKSKYDEKALYVSSSATPTSSKKTEVNSSKDSDSDDGWSISDHSDKTVTNSPPPVSTRKPVLPPMSKGASSKPQLRSRPVSMSSISSLDSYERALHATLPDDEAW